MRKDADWPISVRNISARFGPSQSSDTSVEALRNGKIANDSCGATTALFAVFDVNLPLAIHPPATTMTANIPAAIHFQGTTRTGAGPGIMTDAETGRFPCQASRSARIS